MPQVTPEPHPRPSQRHLRQRKPKDHRVVQRPLPTCGRPRMRKSHMLHRPFADLPENSGSICPRLPVPDAKAVSSRRTSQPLLKPSFLNLPPPDRRRWYKARWGFHPSRRGLQQVWTCRVATIADSAPERSAHRSWLNIPHVTHHDEADITELEHFASLSRLTQPSVTSG